MKEEIIAFFENHIDELWGDMGIGGNSNHPDFELLPRDFVDFAERDLRAGNTTHSLVNATANLKRAIDCQLDYLLVALNLDKLYREKRLGVDKKLGFLKQAGIFRSRSIEKLNIFRNRLEHHYEIPKIDDVEVYFDLVAAFVNVVEAAIPALGHGASLAMRTHGGGFVGTKFIYEGPKLELSLEHEATSYKNFFQVEISESSNAVDKLESFAFLLRVHLLFRKFDEGAIGSRHFLSSLRGETQI